jgi:hypothetical protein
MLACVAAVLVFGGECSVGPETRHSSIEVIATDLTGARIPGVQVEFIPQRPAGEVIKSRIRSARILYGDYQVRVHATGFSDAHREVRVYQPRITVRIELQAGHIACPSPPADISGRIKGADEAGELWVKAVPLRGVGGGEALVSPSGYFLIAGLEYTDYLVFVLQGDKILHQEVVKTYPIGQSNASKLAIDIAGNR